MTQSRCSSSRRTTSGNSGKAEGDSRTVARSALSQSIGAEPCEAAANLERVVKSARVRRGHFSRKPDAARGTGGIRAPARGKPTLGFKPDRRDRKTGNRSSPILDCDMATIGLQNLAILRIVGNKQQRHDFWRVREGPAAGTDDC